MSAVIIGGNECMVRRYQDICKAHGYRAKVFAKENGAGRSLCHLIHRRDLFV